jgi:serine/threonine-protein kinase
LGAYRIVRIIGRGGMGSVYEAVHAQTGERIAIKTLLPHLASSQQSAARFVREAEASGRVRHPHTVNISDVGVANSVPYLVMELLEGEDLSKRLERMVRFRASALIDLILPVCSALVTAHQAGIIHRDLKPENIFIARQRGDVGPVEVVKVLDFGISHIASPADAVRLTQTNSVVGTPYYMSPEQSKGARFADAKSDQWSVGVILYECLTGEVPFPGDSFIEVLRNLVKGTFDPPRKYAPEISEELEAIVLRTLDQDPAKRFPSMRHLARALLPYASPRGRAIWSDAFEEGGATPSEVQVLSSADLAEVKPAKTWLLVAGVAAILLGAGGLAWRVLQADPEVPEAIVEAPVVTPEVVQATPTPPAVEAPVAPTPTVEETPSTEDAPPPARTRPSVGAEETPITTPVAPPEVPTEVRPEVRPETRPHPPVERPTPTEPAVPVGANGAVIVD